MLNDVVSGAINTRKYNKASEIGGYFHALPSDVNPANAASAPQPIAFHDLSIGARSVAPQPSSPKPQTPTGRVPKLRETLAPRQLQFKIPNNAKGQQFIREATRLKLKTAPLSAAFLLRGFIQFVVDSCMIENDIPFREGAKQLELNVRAERVIDHLIKCG